MNDTIRPDAGNTAGSNFPLDKSNAQLADARSKASQKASNESWMDAALHTVDHAVRNCEESVLDFGHGVLYASVQKPIDGSVQLVSHIMDKKYTAPDIISPPKQENFSTQAGEMVGALADVMVLSPAVAGAAAAVGLTAPAWGGPVIAGAVTLGVTGLIVGTLSPVDEKSDYWTEKREQIAVDGAAFCVMGGMAPVAGSVFGGSLMGRTVGGAASGAAASGVQNLMELAFGDAKDDGWENLVKGTIYGAAFGATSWAIESVKGGLAEKQAAEQAEYRAKAARTAFDNDPINNPPSVDDPARGHWTKSSDGNGNTEWTRTYLEPDGRNENPALKRMLIVPSDPEQSWNEVADRLIIRPDGSHEFTEGQSTDNPRDYYGRVLVRPDGSNIGVVAKPMVQDGQVINPRTQIEHSDGTRVEYNGDKITVQKADGTPIQSVASDGQILRGQADTFADQYIVSQLKAVDGITDGVARDQPGESVRPDGTKIMVSQDRAIWAMKPDGTVVISNPNGGRFVGLPDQTEIRDNGHGGIKVKYPRY